MPKSVADRDRAYNAPTYNNKNRPLLNTVDGQSRECRAARLTVSERQRSTDAAGQSTADDVPRNAAAGLSAMNCRSVVVASLPADDHLASRRFIDVAAQEKTNGNRSPLIRGGRRIGSPVARERGENDPDRRTKKSGAERARRYRERKRAGRIKRSPKSAAQRARDYRERKKLTKVRKSPKTPAQRAREYRARKKAAELEPAPATMPATSPKSASELSSGDYERESSNAAHQSQPQPRLPPVHSAVPDQDQLLLANYRELLSVSRMLHDRQLFADPFLYHQLDKRLLNNYGCLIDYAKEQPLGSLLRENLVNGNAVAAAANAKRPPKTAAERVRAYRARKKAGKVKKPAKTPAERARACRARKTAGKVKKPAKTPAERSREYRARQKILKIGLIRQQNGADSRSNQDSSFVVDNYPPRSLSAGSANSAFHRHVDRDNNYSSDSSQRSIDISLGRDDCSFDGKLSHRPRPFSVDGTATGGFFAFHQRHHVDRDSNNYSSSDSSFNTGGSFDGESAESRRTESDRIAVGKIRKTPAERAREYRARKKAREAAKSDPSQATAGVYSAAASVLFGNQDVYMIDRKIPVVTGFVSSSVPSTTIDGPVDAGMDNLNLPDDTNAQIDFISSWSFKHFMAMK